MGVKEVTVAELHHRLQAGEQIFLLDVREPSEREVASIGGELIPLMTLPENLERVPREGEIVVYCHHGGRSQRGAEFLVAQGYQNVANLRGGIDRWSEEIDPRIARY